MKSPDLKQIRVPPEQATPENFAAINKILDTEFPAARDQDQHLLVRARLTLGRILHPLGIHHWIRFEAFDAASQRIIQWPDRWVCTECPRGKVEAR